MILYRDMSYEHYKKILDGEKKTFVRNYYVGKENSFEYKDDCAYMHFFNYASHAKMYLPIFGQMIIKCDIPDELIEEKGYGFYRYKNIAVDVPIPECIIKRDNFSIDFIKEINPWIKNNISYVNEIRVDKLYNDLLKSLYNEWKKNNENYFNDYDGFCRYVIEYFDGRSLDDVLNCYLENYAVKNNKMKMKRR